jgi:2',3'-cyclic-nucleotide 2'-phosphodiesterase (5'-nucleotidase family)
MPLSGPVREAVEVWEARVRERVDVVIAKAERDYSPRDLKAITEEIYRQALKTDLGYQNPGGVRAPIVGGDVTIRDIWNVLPFENTLVTVRIRGANLPEGLAKRLREVDPERVYTLATNSYVAAHHERFFPDGIEGMVDSGRSMRGVVVDWVKERGRLE